LRDEKNPVILYQTDETYKKGVDNLLEAEKKYNQASLEYSKDLNKLNKEFKETIHTSLQYLRMIKKQYKEKMKEVGSYPIFRQAKTEFLNKLTRFQNTYHCVQDLYLLNRIEGVKGIPHISKRLRRIRNWRFRYQFLSWRWFRIRV